MESKDITQMSTAEVEQYLLNKKKEELAEKKAKKLAYEQERDEVIMALMDDAVILNAKLKEFKELTFAKIESYKAIAEEYGGINKSSKGGFSLRTRDNLFMIRYERNILNEFDERADMALNLIQEFMQETVKKRDQQSYLIISKLLVRNKAGDLNVSRVIQLLDLKNEFTDSRWVMAMNLLEESYRDRQISYSISFYKKNTLSGKDELVSLNFTSI